MAREKRQHGFVLVMVLLLLAIVAATVTAVGRRSLDRALQAESAENALQRRWTEVTARYALLSRAEAILSDAEVESRTPVVTARNAVRLGGLDVELAIGDEQAKACAQTLYRMGGLRGADRHIRELTLAHASGSIPLIVELKPPSPTESAEGRAVLTSFAHLFRIVEPGALMGDDAHPGAAAALTCWSDGRLELRRASEEAIAAVCDGILSRSQVRRLIGFRTERPNLTVLEAIELLQPTGKQASLLNQLLTDSSGSHSLWIRTDDGRRSRYTLLIDESGANGGRGDGVIEYMW